MMQRALPVLFSLVILLIGAGVARAESVEPRPFLLHINGIGGERLFDRTLVGALKQAGLEADCETHDWTHGDFGLTALQAYDKHRAEAKKIANRLVERAKQFPTAPIYITAHSGGTGVAAYALEMLPEDVKIQSIFFLAPALSPEYDLSKALRHVTGSLYVFTSPYDSVVLDTGTKMFGTIDGVRGAAAGLRGFLQPSTGDAEQYKKMVHFPYQKGWLVKYGNAGSHICSMRPKFARMFLGPLLLTGKVPMDETIATTRPSRAVGSAGAPK